MVVSNEGVKELIVEIPEGHKHIRTTIILTDGEELTFQEATIANLVRAYITVKTHPVTNRISLKGGRLTRKKDGYAEWQLLELDLGISCCLDFLTNFHYEKSFNFSGSGMIIRLSFSTMSPFCFKKAKDLDSVSGIVPSREDSSFFEYLSRQTVVPFSTVLFSSR